jgi:hypothetical protein
MKQHPLCTDCEPELDLTGLPIPFGFKREWSAVETRRQFLGRSGKVQLFVVARVTMQRIL